MAQLTQLAKQLGIDDQVSFTGTLPNEKIAAALKTFDIYIRLSRYEGFSLSITRRCWQENQHCKSKYWDWILSRDWLVAPHTACGFGPSRSCTRNTRVCGAFEFQSSRKPNTIESVFATSFHGKGSPGCTWKHTKRSARRINKVKTYAHRVTSAMLAPSEISIASPNPISSGISERSPSMLALKLFQHLEREGVSYVVVGDSENYFHEIPVMSISWLIETVLPKLRIFYFAFAGSIRSALSKFCGMNRQPGTSSLLGSMTRVGSASCIRISAPTICASVSHF